MNRWSFLTALVVVAGAVAVFAVYVFGWRSDGADSASKARSYADALVATCDPKACEVVSLVRVSGNDWKVVIRDPNDGSVGCALIQSRRFSPRASGGFAGVSTLACPEARSAKVATQPPEPGPDSWDTTTAEDNLEHSKWVFDHGVNGGVFSCVGQGPTSDGDTYRRFACTYSSAGPTLDKEGRVVIATTGADTFRVLSSQ